MKEEICQVVPAGIEAIDLDIGHVGKPGQRVPVSHARIVEGPDYPLAGQAGPDLTIARYITLIVITHEIITSNRGVHIDGKKQQQKQGKLIYAVTFVSPLYHLRASFLMLESAFRRT
jgi:hypothetical protein